MVRITERDYATADSMMWRKTILHKTVFGAYLVANVIVWIILGIDLFRYASYSMSASPQANLKHAISELTSSAVWLIGGYILFKAIRYVRQKREYKRNWNLHGEQTWMVSMEGVSVKSANGDSSYETWDAFECWRESQRVFLIIFPSRVYYIIPKGSMTASQHDELRAVFLRVLPRK